MLNLETVLAKTEAIYTEQRPGEVGIRSEQIKALAKVLVDEINTELHGIAETIAQQAAAMREH
jgi:hypothetical protein